MVADSGVVNMVREGGRKEGREGGRVYVCVRGKERCIHVCVCVCVCELGGGRLNERRKE